MGREGEDVLCSLKLTEDEGKNYENATMYRLAGSQYCPASLRLLFFPGTPRLPSGGAFSWPLA